MKYVSDFTGSFRREIRAKFRYVAKEPDEMSLSCNDLVEVYRELGDGKCSKD